MNQAGASHLLGLDGPSCIALGVVLSIDMLSCGSGKGSCLLAMGTIWELVWGKQPWVVALPQGVPWQEEQMEVTEVIAPIRHGRR